MANITRYNPFREMVSMQSALDKLFDETWSNWPEMRRGEFNLALDVDETGEHFLVTTDLPGVDPDNINVTVHDDLLTITGEIPEHTVEHEEQKALVRERRYGRYTRSIRLPQSIDSEHVEAEFINGTLHLTLPKTENAKARVIPVKAGNGSK